VLQVHSKGLKFGLHVDLGNETCGGFPGSLGYYSTDARTLAEWGVDFVTAAACRIKDVQSCNDGKHYTASSVPIIGLAVMYNISKSKSKVKLGYIIVHSKT